MREDELIFHLDKTKVRQKPGPKQHVPSVHGNLRCCRCEAEKPEDMFAFKRTIPRGRSYYCRACTKADREVRPPKRLSAEDNRLRAAEWRAANLEHYRAYQAAYRLEHKLTHPRKNPDVTNPKSRTV